MKRFFALTFRPFFVITGIGTLLGALNAFWPRWTAESVLKIPFDQDYTIILQHWGIMLGVMGIFMMVAAYRTDWRTPILLFSLLEKSFIVYLVVANASQPYAKGLFLGAGMDAAVVLYTLAYFKTCGANASPLAS